ncbi:MAG: hypothetical protein M5R41_10515 [Bacteroidia bacterium]|nr:hypothetical protein [Bacteroidia bacterium]
MRSVIITALLLVLLAGGLSAQVQTTFKTVADGQEQINGEDIAEPEYSLTREGGQPFQFTPPRTLQLDPNVNYKVLLLDDRITPDILYKHHNWDGQVAEHRLLHLFNTGNPQNPIEKVANFFSPASVQIFNNFEEFADDGTVRFRDPWFVDGNGDQTGEPNDFPSPYIPTGNANYPDPSDAAVFLDQPVTSGRPFYSAEFPTFLSWDRGSTVTPPLAQGDWSLVRVYARDADDAVLTRGMDFRDAAIPFRS